MGELADFWLMYMQNISQSVEATSNTNSLNPSFC
jgi:hypothetical protein